MTKIFSVTCALLLFAEPILAVDDCTIARTASYKIEPVYQVNRSHIGSSRLLVHETGALLFRRGINEAVVNELAKSVSYLNGGSTMRIELDPNCGWSDGEPISVDEILEGIRQTFSEGKISSNVGRSYIKNGQEIINGELDISELGIRKIDEQTLEIDILVNGGVMEKVLTRQNFTPFPIHLSSQELAHWESGDIQRVSSGAFYVTHFGKDKIEMERNPYFCKEHFPQIEKQIYYQTENNATQAGMFLNGQINLVERYDNRTLRALEARESQIDYKVRELSTETVAYLLQSDSSHFLENQKLREAIFLATDLDKFTEILDLDKKFLSQKGALSYPFPGYDVPNDPLFEIAYSERIELAEEIIAEFKSTANEDIKLKVIVLENPTFEQVKPSLKSMWAQVGIQTEFETIELKDFSWEKLGNWPGGYDYFLVGAESDYPDPLDFLSWINVHTPSQQFEHFSARLEATLSMVDNDKRYEELRSIELGMRKHRRALSLFSTTAPWIIDAKLEFYKYFFPLGMNIKSETCPSKK